MTGTPEAISDATNGRPPPPPPPYCCHSHGSHSSYAGWGHPRSLFQGEHLSGGQAATQHSLQGPSSRSSVQMPEQGHPGRGNIQMVTAILEASRTSGKAGQAGRPTRDGKCKRQRVWPRSDFQLTRRSLLMPLHRVGKADHSGASIWQGGQRACLDFTWDYTSRNPAASEDGAGWGSVRHS